MRGWDQSEDVISTLLYKLLHNDMVIGELYFDHFIFLMIIYGLSVLCFPHNVRYIRGPDPIA